MQVSTRQPLNTVSAPGQSGGTEFGNKPVQRALCTVVVGKSQDAFVWLEKSLDKFTITAHSGKSMVIVDDTSMAMLQRYASGNNTLYQRLVDREVTFVAASTVMTFVRKKYGRNQLPQLLRTLKTIRFANTGETKLGDFLRASVLKLLCSDYAFSHNQQLQRVGVVDADSLIPIQPGISASTGKSAIPINMLSGLTINTIDGCTFNMPSPAFVDSEFFLTSLKYVSTRLNQPMLIYNIHHVSHAHTRFFELGSAKLAEKLAAGVIQTADNLQQMPWKAKVNVVEKTLRSWQSIGEGESLFWVGHGLSDLIDHLHLPPNLICLQYCHDHRQSDVTNCHHDITCAEDLHNLQHIVSISLHDPLVLLSLKSLARDIEKLSPTTNIHICCSDKARLHMVEFCHKSLDYNLCLQSEMNNRAMSLVHLMGTVRISDFNVGILSPREALEKLLPSFGSPLMDWGFQSSVTNFRPSVTDKPETIIALGKEHADILLSNASTFFQLDASWSLQCPQKTPSPQSPSLFDQPITGLKYGVVTGLADELFSFTTLPTQYTWLYHGGRGFCFGGETGLMLSLGETIYLQYIEPALPDGLLKACIRPVARNTLLAAALLQGQAVSVLASMAGYAAVRSMGTMARYLWTRAGQATSEQAHGTDPQAADKQ